MICDLFLKFSVFKNILEVFLHSELSTLCCCSVAQSYLTLCDPTDCSTTGFPVLHHLPEFALTHFTESMMPSNDRILCRPLLLLPSIFPSIRVFSNESALCIRWPKVLRASASASVLPKNVQGRFPLGWTGLISLQSQGLLRVFSKTTVQKHQFFSAHLSL